MKKWLFLLLAAAGLCALPVQPVGAANDAIGQYSVTPVLPANQRTQTSGYFDLLVQPNQTQTLQVRLTNSADRTATFQVWANPAMTSDNGAIDYGQRTKAVDKTVPLDFRQVATLDKHRYTVGAKQTVVIPIHLKLPATKFTGRVLGGLNVTQSGSGTSTTKGNTVIKNKVGYSLGIVLQQSTAVVPPELRYLSGKPKAINRQTTLQLTFRNPAATIIPTLKFHTVVTRNGKKYLDNHSTPYQVAPNTKFHLNLGLDGDRIQPGTYKVDIVATSGRFFKRHFRSQFTVDAAQAQRVNKNAIFKTQPLNYWMIIAIVAVALLILLLLIGWWRRRKAKQ